MMQQHSKPITTTNTNDEFHDANKKQKQTLQMSKQPPKAEQKLRTRIPKKNEEIQVKQTQTICTNIRNSLVSHNYNDIATQNKTKHCTDEGK